MKLKFEVEKNYKGKIYYAGNEYEFSEEEAKDILSKTKYAHVSKKDVCKESKKKSKKTSGIEQKQEETSVVVETVENEVENT